MYRQLTLQAAGYKVSMVGNLFNALLTAFVFREIVGPSAFVAAFAWIACLVLWRGLIVRAISRCDSSSAKLGTLARHLTVNAIGLGGTWGGVCGALLATSPPEYQLFAAIVGAGMVSAGSIAYRSHKSAALGYVLASVPGILSGLLLVGHKPALAAAGLLGCYVLVLASNIRTQAAEIVNGFQRERELQRSRDVVSLLLNDYEEQGSDWVMELDKDLCIANPGPRFASAAHRQPEVLAGKPFLSLFDMDDGRSAVAGHLLDKRAFRQELVALTIDGDQHWWSVSARPVKDSSVAFRGVISDVTAQKTAEAKVSYMAHYDALTNLPNRFVFIDAMEKALSQPGQRAGLLCLDLDQFKHVNDTLGHPIGDKLLRQVAQRLSACICDEDMLARLGGDEFAIVVGADRVEQMDELANTIIRSIAAPFQINGHDIQIGVSIGMCIGPRDGRDVEHMSRSSDLALYAAKGQGRNCAVWFRPEMDEVAQGRRQLELDLRAALTEGQLRLSYQPLINPNTGRARGYEALVRWEHPDRGIIMPSLFIPVAEDNGMIVQIGEWVIRQALSDLAQWDEEVELSINLSPAQMRSPSLLSTIMNGLARHNLDARRLCLEITESVLLQDSAANLETLHKLRSMGIKIALDDFGTGYSSFNYLRSFPFDKIKIDRSFVSEIDSRVDCRAIVRSVITLARSLGMTVTAEGVEREAQANILISEGSDELQGFLYSKAIPSEQLTDLRTRSDLAVNPVSRLGHDVNRLTAEQRAG